MTKKTRIWALFSIDNNYDQPPNNLVAWWSEKPDIKTIADAMNVNFAGARYNGIVVVGKVWAGHAARCAFDTEYRLEEVEEGIVE